MLTARLLALIPPESTYKNYKVAKAASQGTSWLGTLTTVAGFGLGVATGGVGFAVMGAGTVLSKTGQKVTESVNDSADNHE